MAAKILLRKTSLVDYPGRISSVFFFSGCNLRCPWCHNGELVTGGAQGLVSLEEGLAHLRKRSSVLGGVVLSGGEPCLCEELPGLIGEIKKIGLSNGLAVKLDTNGMFPAMLEKLFSREETRPDYIALDLKIAPSRYGELAIQAAETPSGEERGNTLGEKLSLSAALIRASGIAREYRTLGLPGGFITGEDIEALSPLVDDAPWYFRPFRGGNCLESAWDSLEENSAEAHARLKALAEKAKELGKNAIII